MTMTPPPPTTLAPTMRSKSDNEEEKESSNPDGNDVVAYALVDDEDGNDSSSLYLSHRPCPEDTSSDIVSQWYDHYAHLYPSPQYMKRRQHQQQRQRHRLLQQQQLHEQEKIMREKSTNRGGLLRLPSFIFGKWMGGGRSSSATTASVQHLEEEKDGVILDEKDEDDDEDEEVDTYYNHSIIHATRHNHNQLLFFDEIIPPREATSFHRFHLVSERRALSIPSALLSQIFGTNTIAFDANSDTNQDTTNSNNSSNNSWNNIVIPVRPCIMDTRTIASNDDATPHYCIVGYGQIAEFDPSTSVSGQYGGQVRENNNSFSSPCTYNSNILFTSDWQRLSNNNMSSSLSSSPSSESNSKMPQHDPRHVRAASIGRNCIIISWGILREDDNDTVDEIVFYRKSACATTTTAHQHQQYATPVATVPIIGWEAVAVASPSDKVVRDALQNITPRTQQATTTDENGDEQKGDDEENQHHRRTMLHTCRSLIVTDLVPMTIRSNGESEVVLAISRLGGYVELLPVPGWVCTETLANSSSCYSAVASSSTTKRHWRQTDDKKKKKKKGMTTPCLPNLTTLSKITSFSPAQYHSDVMSMDAYTFVTDSVGREEVVLATCGRWQRQTSEGKDSSHTTTATTVLSLWGISIERPTQQQQPSISSSSPSPPAFPLLRVSRRGHATLENVGANVSSFLSNAAAERWATSRYDNDGDIDTNCYDYPRPSKRRKKNTIHEQTSLVATAIAPVVSLRFTLPCQNKKSPHRVLLAALDYNGGVSVFDCTEACENATNPSPGIDDDLAFDGDVIFGARPVDLNSVDDRIDMKKMILLCSRESTMSIPSGGSRVQCLSHKMKLARASQMEWWPHEVQGEPSFTLATYATMVRSRKRSSRITPRRRSIVRLQRWSSLAETECSGIPNDVFDAAMSSNIGVASSISLLPMTSQHLSLFDHDTLSFLQLSSYIVPAPSSPSSCNRIRLRLSVCTIRKIIDPTDIITALLRRGDAPRAIDVARRFGLGAADGRYRGDERLMDECQIDLWETKRDPQALKLISDDAYVIRQALELANDNIRQNSLTLNDLLEIFRVALARCEGSEADKELSAYQLRETIRRLGTYILVLNHLIAAATYGVSPNDQTQHIHARRFLHNFNHESLYGIASCAASNGDTITLTVIMARHPFSLHERMILLELIPFEVDIGLYEHLMPCNNDEMKREDALFLLRTQGTFLSHPQMFAHLCDLQLDRRQQMSNNSVEEPPIEVFIDEIDRSHIMRHLEGAPKSAPDVSPLPELKEEVASWYLKRALHTHNKTGQTLPVKAVCAAGLARLGLSSFSDGGKFNISDMEILSSSVAVGRLVYLFSASSLACLVSLGKMKDFMSHSHLSIESIAQWKDRHFLSAIQLCSMELSHLFNFILESGSTHSIPLIHKHVANLVDGSHCLEPMNGAVQCSIKNIDLAEKIGHDMAQLCLDKLKGLRRSKGDAGKDSQHLTIRLEETLAMCANFISFGQLHSESKLDRNNDNHIQFVDSIFHATIEVSNGDWDMMTDGVIGKLWSIFELISYAPNESDISSSQFLLRILYFRLATLHLCKKWHLHQEFPREFWRGNHGNRELCGAGLRVISFICSGFCEMVARMPNPRDDGHDPMREFALLIDFVSDVDEFDTRFFSAAIQQAGYLVKDVLSPLLHQHSFVMLHNIFKLRPSWFSQDLTNSIVSAFVRDVSTSQDGRLECCAILGHWFPYLHVKVEHQQHMSDARGFMANAMNLEETMLTRLVSGDQSTMDLVRNLVSIDPRVILLGCEFWSDGATACSACTDAAVYFSSEIRAALNGGSMEESVHILPPMPGALVMQLANILGLGTPHELLIVKRNMVDGALNMSLGPAAAAICYSMLCDASYSTRRNTANDAEWTSLHECQVLDCVVAVATDPSLLDVSVKKEMCSFALRLFASANSHIYQEIFDVLKQSEYDVLSTAAGHRDQNADPRSARTSEASDFSMFQAAEMVAREFIDHSCKSSNNTSELGSENNFFNRSLNSIFRDMKSLSQIDLLQLIAFTGNTGERSMDSNESALEKISEAILQWIVSAAFQERIDLSTTLPVAKIHMISELGMSCLLECEENGASRILSRTMGNFKSKAALSMSRLSASPRLSFQPDQSIVQRLVDRGYTRNAARRAVMMTSNQSYSAALTWAVSHFQDADFDSPNYILRNVEGPPVCANQYLIDVVDRLLRTVQRIVKEKLSHSKMNKTPGATASAKVTSSRNISITPKERFVSKIPSPSSRASPVPFQDKSTSVTDQSRLNDKTTVRSTGQLHHSTAVLNDAFVSKLSSPSTIKESFPLIAVAVGVGDRTIETPEQSLLSKQPPLPNSADSSSSVEGSLSSRASIKNQIQRGMTKFGTQKLSAEERNRLAIEGRRLLEEARARGRSVIAPPTEITTSYSSNNDVSKK